MKVTENKAAEERRRKILNDLYKEVEIRRKRAGETQYQASSTKSQMEPLTSFTDRKHIQSIGKSIEEPKSTRTNEISESERFNQFLLKDTHKDDSSARRDAYNERMERFMFERKDNKYRTQQVSTERISPKELHTPSSEFNKKLKDNQEAKNKQYVNPRATGLSSEEKYKPSLPRPEKPTYMQPTANTEMRNLHNPTGLPPTAHKLAQERDQRVKKECTFKPQIELGQYKKKLEQTKQERLTRLYEPKTTEQQQREKLKRQKEDEEFSSSCTFQPRTFGYTSSVKPVNERLYSDATQRLEKQREGFRNKQLRNLRDCTFKPDIAKSTQSVKGNRIASKPIYDRFKDIQREKTKLMQRLKTEDEIKNKNLTFRPKILDTNRTLNDDPAFDRLYKDAERRHEKSVRLSELANEARFTQYSFTPRLYRSTYSIDALGEDRLLSKRFEERQELYEQRKRDNEVQRMTKYSEVQFPFKPQINSMSEAMVEANTKRLNESKDEKFKRLSQKDPKKQEKIKIIRDYVEKHSYHPRINDTSRAMVLNKSSNISMDQGKSKQQEIQQERAECTFQPRINSSQVNSRYAQHNNIMDIIHKQEQEKAKNLEQKKRDQEYEELKACTFRPSTIKMWEQPEPVAVKGLTRYLELQEKKRKIERDFKERERAAFELGTKYDKHGKHSTTFKPFNLSKGNLKIRKQEKFCFQPETNHSKRFLKNLVKQSDNMPKEYTKGIHP